MTELNEERILKIEAEEVLKEVAYAVKCANLSSVLPSSNECVYLNILTKEEVSYCIELSVQGFKIVGMTFDSTERDEDSQSTMYYETIYALLDSVSPEYRKSFGDALMTKLTALEELEDDKHVVQS